MRVGDYARDAELEEPNQTRDKKGQDRRSNQTFLPHVNRREVLAYF